MRWLLAVAVGTLLIVAGLAARWADEEPSIAPPPHVAVEASVTPPPIEDAGVQEALPRIDFDDPYCDPAATAPWEFDFDTKARTFVLRRGSTWSTSPWTVRMPLGWVDDLQDAIGESDIEGARAVLERGERLVPGDVTSALAMVLLSRSDADPRVAIEKLDEVLRSVESKELERMRARLLIARDIQAPYEHFREGKLTLQWPQGAFTEPRQLLQEIIETRDRVSARLELPADRRLRSVVVYPSRSELIAVSCAPDWAGGLFDGTIRLIASDGSVSYRAARHEAAHSVLRVLNGPRWLHEGLAREFEDAPLPRQLWRQMVEKQVWLPIETLDAALVGDDPGRAALAYAESLALVRMFDRCKPPPGTLRWVVRGIGAGKSPAEVFRVICDGELTKQTFLLFLSREL